MPEKIPYDRLFRLARNMHLWIQLYICDEKDVYDSIGLTDEENAALGYGGHVDSDGVPQQEAGGQSNE